MKLIDIQHILLKDMTDIKRNNMNLITVLIGTIVIGAIIANIRDNKNK